MNFQPRNWHTAWTTTHYFLFPIILQSMPTAHSSCNNRQTAKTQNTKHNHTQPTNPHTTYTLH